MTYDLRQLRLAGLIHRLPHSNRYQLTPEGIQIAVFYTKVYNRLMVPLTAADQPQAPPEIRQTLRTLDRHGQGRCRPATAQTGSLKLDTDVKTRATEDR